MLTPMRAESLACILTEKRFGVADSWLAPPWFEFISEILRTGIFGSTPTTT